MSYYNESLFERHPIIISTGIGLCVIGFIAFSIYSTYNFFSTAGRAPKSVKFKVDLESYNILLDQIQMTSRKDIKSPEGAKNTLPGIDPEEPDKVLFIVDVDGEISAKLILEKQKLFLKKGLYIILRYTAIFAAALAPFVLFVRWINNNFINDQTAQIIEDNTEKSRKIRKEAHGIFLEAEMLKGEAMMEKQEYISKKQTLEADLNEKYEKIIINLKRKNKEDLKQQDSRNKNVLQEKNKQIDDLKNKIRVIRTLSEKW